ncbi:EPS15 homology domain 1 [Perilla frutescens var. hirtella]|uniref:EPS15 homology domain 1 n=1 Tax=Perilla frutescens var. hirtella TaxID=608512 RepID=A0AAD4NWD9_PERFH|nr:EPS15 homology domain 1 [Perilla frutescens var. hirtella]
MNVFSTSFVIVLTQYDCCASRYAVQWPDDIRDCIFVEIRVLATAKSILSNEKQRTQRSYDFTGVISWFAMKYDLILLLFDPHKLDVSNEFKRVIESLRGHDDKIHVVFNKADQVDTQHEFQTSH